MTTKLNRKELIEKLEPIKYESQEGGDQLQLDQSNLVNVLLTLAEVNHEREYELCRAAALHLLGELNEPEDIVLD